MATYASDEEQIEALSNWWKENGTRLIIVVVIALVALFSSRQWQSSVDTNAGMASDIYQEMVDLTSVGFTSEISDENFESAQGKSAQLRNDYASSIYSRFSALLMAKFYVERDELELAKSELNWILDNPKLGFLESLDEELLYTTRLRLARVVLAQGEAQAALDILSEVEVVSFLGAYSEVKGDAYMSLGQIDAARSAYQVALETASNPALLQLKLEDIGG